MVNVLWGMLNLAVGYFLVFHVGDFYLRDITEMLVLGPAACLAGTSSEVPRAVKVVRWTMR